VSSVRSRPSAQAPPWNNIQGVFYFGYNLFELDKNRLRFFFPAGLVLFGLLLLGLYFTRPVTLVVDGSPHVVRGFTVTVQDALRLAGAAPGPDDWLSLSPGSWLPADGLVFLERARPVSIWTGGLPLTFNTPERSPGNLLARVNLPLYPGDVLLSNGLPVDPLQPLPRAENLYLQYHPAVALTVIEGGTRHVIYSAAETIGQALWQASLRPGPGDRVSLPLDQPLTGLLEVRITRARRLVIAVEGREIESHSVAVTVGEALAEVGLSLQGLDRSTPPEEVPLPADGRIRLVRVREELVFQQTTVPFKSTYTPDATLELDARSVLSPGKLGVKVGRQRVRYEDGVEVSRQTEAEWVAVQPQDQVLGYGTQAVTKTLDTPDGTIEYYRAVPMFATSYSPCQQGLGRCSRSTSSGTPLQKGIVAVTLSWYRQFKGARLYIPGYGFGVIADVGGGIPGTYWIDLGYSEEDYVGWAQTVTVYFLTPAPASAPAILP
jgi:uncharacterized protein YabE (DUF348 family)